MSVLKSKRKESKVEFLRVANEIYEDTLWFLSRLSDRYQRFLCEHVMKLGCEVISETVKANHIIIQSKASYEARKIHLSEALSSLNALDVQLGHIWALLMRNPEGCFRNSAGESKPPSEAISKLNSMAENLGNKIEYEENMIKKIMKSDKEKYNKIKAEEKETIKN